MMALAATGTRRRRARVERAERAIDAASEEAQADAEQAVDAAAEEAQGVGSRREVIVKRPTPTARAPSPSTSTATRSSCTPPSRRRSRDLRHPRSVGRSSRHADERQAIHGRNSRFFRETDRHGMHYVRARQKMIREMRGKGSDDLGTLSNAEAQAVVFTTYLFRLYNRMSTFVLWSLLRKYVQARHREARQVGGARLAHQGGPRRVPLRTARVQPDARGPSRVPRARGRTARRRRGGGEAVARRRLPELRARAQGQWVYGLHRPASSAEQGQHPLGRRDAAARLVSRGADRHAPHDPAHRQEAVHGAVLQGAQDHPRRRVPAVPDHPGPRRAAQPDLPRPAERGAHPPRAVRVCAVRAWQPRRRRLVAAGNKKIFSGAKGQAGARRIARALVVYGKARGLGEEWNEATRGRSARCPPRRRGSATSATAPPSAGTCRPSRTCSCGIHGKATPEAVVASAMKYKDKNKQGKPITPWQQPVLRVGVRRAVRAVKSLD